jgi:hypothetical protein
MRRVLFVAMLTGILSLGGWAQSSMTPALQNAPARQSSLKEYAGPWIGRFEGRPWFSIMLTLKGDQLTGRLQRARDVQFNDQGGVKSVGSEKSTGSIESAQLTDGGLLLTVKDTGTQRTDRYVMRLTSDATAEVSPLAISVPPGVSTVKPWSLTKVASNAVTPVR